MKSVDSSGRQATCYDMVPPAMTSSEDFNPLFTERTLMVTPHEEACELQAPAVVGPRSKN